ncbi:MAG: HDIG domain-containing protein [Candidatus Moranbacteria bacterium]|nr:HDIG domain-containing protein [Candidatus Moranbacteria bacterium]
MNPIEIIEKYYDPRSEIFQILVSHCEAVRDKALQIATNLEKKKGVKIDKEFLNEASMLHDIGVFLVSAHGIDCNGNEPYIKHGILGREILEKEGLPKHALVSERHVGVGITKEEIERERLPLPKRDMLPESIEEKIICLADLFFSKSRVDAKKEKSINDIKKNYEKFGKDNISRLNVLIAELL